MASEERKQADRALEELNLHKSLGAGEQEAETDAFQCGRCKEVGTESYDLLAVFTSRLLPLT
jgi:hypothetical protein